MVKRCERCTSDTHFMEKCTFCERYVCRACIRASKNVKKVNRIVICKSCFGDISKMKKYENM